VRIEALLRPRNAFPAPSAVFEIGKYTFDPAKQKLTFSGKDVSLSHREAELLRRLYQLRNQVLEKNVVLLELWGDDSFFNGRSLDVFITRLRRYLKDDPQIQIVNIRGVGYKLII
jgi:DNA-binding response OmpR family regulator